MELMIPPRSDDPKKTNHLLALDGAKERLHLFQADLLKDGSFDDAIEGCDGVFHAASPFFIHTDNPQDVANAHILAFETPSASGRYCMAESVVHFSELVQMLHKLYPSFKLPDKCADDGPIVKYQISNEKARSLGIEYIALEDGIKETIESLKEKKFI
ncbi:hypothetical protein L1987_10102 [Smallanthus sonchifolius]|uniref:Uncharacterized protein n=1 Tax=Smallanthus sonchifolius TaxID=185202 RepID=A0ACB9JRC4_9ASTR|nr:hypothetical protein L1987_10102 [Smallanthus sonchifolius]